MASVFKRTYRDRKGREVECKTWTAAFQDGSDPTRDISIPRQLSAFASREASEELGRNLDKLSALRGASEPMPAPLRRYFDRLPGRTRAKLAEWGMLNQTAEAAKSTLAEHLAAYIQALETGTASAIQRGRPATVTHVRKVKSRIDALLDGMKARMFQDIKPASVKLALDAFQVKGRRVKGIGAQTRAHYQTALNAFLEWCVRERRLIENPLRGIGKPDPSADRKHVRRAFEPDEIARLLEATRRGGDSYGMTGEARYWLYKLAVETGYRAGELRALSVANVTFGKAPSITIPAAFAKSRKERTVPLKPATADGLRDFIGKKTPGARLFRMPRPDSIVYMLRKDLKAAGIPYRDDADRVVDFHSFRVTFATFLIASGANLKVVQELCGHSAMTMTLGVYVKSLRGTHETAIANLPDYPEPATMQATGTDGRASSASVVKTARNGTQNGVGSSHDDARTGGVYGQRTANVNPCQSNELSRKEKHVQEQNPKRAYLKSRACGTLWVLARSEGAAASRSLE